MDYSPPSFRRACSRALLLLTILVAGCSEPTGVTTDLAVAEARWAQAAPAVYEFTLRRACYCSPDAVRPVVIRVQNGQVASVRYADTGLTPPAVSGASYPTIDGLFAVIENATRAPAADIQAHFDPDFGFPQSIYIDYYANAVDDELGLYVTGFRAL